MWFFWTIRLVIVCVLFSTRPRAMHAYLMRTSSRRAMQLIGQIMHFVAKTYMPDSGWYLSARVL